MRIGYVNPEYGARRIIIGRCPNVDYVRVRSFKSLGDKVREACGLHYKNSTSPYFFNGGISQGLKRVDLYHFWNNIALLPCRKPYITSFELEVPRKFPNGELLMRGAESLLSDQCRKLIAFSKRAMRFEIKFASEHGFGDVEKKITVLLPPQKAIVSEQDILQRYSSYFKKKASPLKVIFVGRDFFQKGGSAIIHVVAKLRKEFNIEAFVIGDFAHITHASSWEVDSAKEMKKFVDENSDWLHYFNSLPNQDVLALAKTCHLGLLPTRDDTFGYSVLEFQACGLPCITTDVCSLPEVNNDEVGWLINVPQSNDGFADFHTVDKMRELHWLIEEGLEKQLREALLNPESVFDKGVKALRRIRKYHSPEEYGDRLFNIYQEALG